MSVVEYAFCKVCRIHHNAGRRHNFTKKHKDRLSVILLKFRKKESWMVKDARRCLKKPVVEEGEVEPDAKIWCYCCEEEVNKHVTDRDISIVQGGVLQHMASSDHHKKTRHFWWQHGVDITEQPHFLLHQLDYERYVEVVDVAVKAVEEKIEEKQKKDVAALRQQDIKRKMFFHSQSSSALPSQTAAHVRDWHAKSEGDGIRYEFSNSDMAVTCLYNAVTVSNSFTSIASSASGRTKNQRSKGNVYTGAVPPWLRGDDNDDDETSIIGPSEELFLNHVLCKKNRGKNPKRVGAEFMQQMKHMKRDEDDDDGWLPSFGRVWNHGPRSHSKFEFISESGIRKRCKHGGRNHRMQHDDGSVLHTVLSASLQDDDAAQRQSNTFTSEALSAPTFDAFPDAVVQHPETVYTGYSVDHVTFRSRQLQDLSVQNQTHARVDVPVNTIVESLYDACPIASSALPDTNKLKESKETMLTQASLTDSNKLLLLSEMLAKHKQELLQSLKRKKGDNQ
ncbi:centrosomal AT-AC splicing factor-like [Corticium candelabrum]|uniref:centrosomal AT-AC splicing factor-like n=1 Tax=Corticium candelabrum TaxID=121492 RepID=UPI002E268205|nr:centrosomal AT-AC splicing factor-like [Corticium candelabrum]